MTPIFGEGRGFQKRKKGFFFKLERFYLNFPETSKNSWFEVEFLHDFIPFLKIPALSLHFYANHEHTLNFEYFKAFIGDKS